MALEQVLKLGPLPENHSMLILLRWKLAKAKKRMSDPDLLEQIERLRLEDPDEYFAMIELTGGTQKLGPEGLALGLAQVESHVSRYNLSFTDYVDIYRKTRLNDCPARFFREIEEDGQVRESQRSLWTTWKINVAGLSQTAEGVSSNVSIH